VSRERHSERTLRDGVRLQRAGDVAAALELYGAVLAREPRNGYAYYLAGVAYCQRGRFHQAARHLRAAARLEPDEVETHYRLGLVCEWIGDLRGAERAYRRTIRLEPGRCDALFHLGSVLRKQGRLRAGNRYYDRALERSAGAEDPKTKLYRAVVLLRRGDWEQWLEVETQTRLWGIPPRRSSPPPVPQWRGEPLEGKRILVRWHNGYGDTMQLVRFVPDVAARGVDMVLQVQPRLTRLLRASMPEHIPVISSDDPIPDVDAWSTMFDLPAMLNIKLADVTRHRYLTPPKGGPRLGESAGLRAGVVWVTSTHLARRRRHICPISKLEPLFELPGIEWYSLQLGEHADEGGPYGLRRTDHITADWADTASVIDQLDFVASVDTAVAHLTGALGVPLLLLLPSVPRDYRWLKDRPDSGWYPSAALFRQPRRGDWASVVRQVASHIGRHRLCWLERRRAARRSDSGARGD
jgi:hypothetical protein